MESPYAEPLLRSDNLVWAWKKVKRLLVQADGPIDAAEIAAFELNLEFELNSIRRELESGAYTLQPLEIFPQPKKPGTDGSPRMRESFHISVRDQVAWTALVNVIGPELDSVMPKWSYGHRLYKAAWYEIVNDKRRLALGPYRHTAGNLYRKFKHSWPLFRRHISLTSRLMAAGPASIDEVLDEVDEGEKAAYAVDGRPEYLSKDYWPQLSDTKLFFASLDLEKFYPSIRRAAILRALAQFLPGYVEDRWLQRLIKSMLRFSVSEAGEGLVERLNIEPATKSGEYNGVPTGLMVAGFLSNVAMLPLDDLVETRLAKIAKTKRRIAHLRFVDDHAILSPDFDELVSWIRWYEGELKRLRIGPKVATEKYDPKAMGEIIAGDDSYHGEVRKLCEIDGANPTKLLTRTLALVSTLAGTDFDTISESTRHQRLDELTWLLLAHLPDDEIRSDTRVAFAAGRITTIVPGLRLAGERVLHYARERSNAKSAQQRELATEQLKIHLALEASDHRKFRARYFRLLFKAFCEFPEKPRLFLQLIRYCFLTGYDGLPAIFEWLTENDSTKRAGLVGYLRILAVQAVARYVLESAYLLKRQTSLHRQREAANQFLRNACQLEPDARRLSPLLRHELWKKSLIGLGAAYRGAAEIIRPTRPSLTLALNRAAAKQKVPKLNAASISWFRSTGHPIGVWSHLLGWGETPNLIDPDEIWRVTAPHHNPMHILDWNSLRKHPARIPAGSTQYLKSLDKRLVEDDAGWLWDFIRSDESPTWLTERKEQPYLSVKRHLSEIEGVVDYITLEKWIKQVSELAETDPRGSEWTALELVRKLLDTTSDFGSSLELLDELHPSNILVPQRWLKLSPLRNSPMWTWEGWRQEMGRKRSRVQFVRNRIRDYRRTTDENEADLWDGRLRACGLILFGLLRKDFSLPAIWNIRGNERDIALFVRSELEGMAVSSFTHAIIDAALLPRSVENRLILKIPEFFFGEDVQSTIGDTTTDAPVINGPEELLAWIDKAQGALVELQISVLNHAPRQLVPMNVVQLTQSAIELVGADDEVAE